MKKGVEAECDDGTAIAARPVYLGAFPTEFRHDEQGKKQEQGEEEEGSYFAIAVFKVEENAQ